MVFRSSSFPNRSSGPGVSQTQFSLPSAIRSGQLDPFQSHPASRVLNVDIFLKHCKYRKWWTCAFLGHVTLIVIANVDLSALVMKSFPFFHAGAVVELWWPFLFTDDVLFHIILYLSARNLEMLQSKADDIQSNLAKGEALRLLNQRMSKEDQISDQTIVAVANLMTIEV
jgi:hypothetical protein